MTMKTRYTASALVDWGESCDDETTGYRDELAVYKEVHADSEEEVVKKARAMSITGEAYYVICQAYNEQFDEWVTVDSFVE